MSDTDGNPSRLNDQQMFHVCAGVFEEHFGTIFVSRSQGRRFIADLRRRAGSEPPPVREDLPGDEQQYAAKTGEVVLRLPKPRARDHQVREVDLLPNPIPGRANIRIGVVDEGGVVAEMELGNAPPPLAEAVIQILIREHAASLRKRQSETS